MLFSQTLEESTAEAKLLFLQRISSLPPVYKVLLAFACNPSITHLHILSALPPPTPTPFLVRMASQSYDAEVVRKRGRDEYWSGGAGPAVEGKRAKNHGLGSLLLADTPLMALLERIDSPEEEVSESPDLGIQQEERLSGVIKSLEEEIGLNQQQEPPKSGDSSYNSSLKQGEEEASSVADDVGDLMRPPFSELLQVQLADRHYYEDIRFEFGFFADELGINHCACIDSNSMASIYPASHASFGDYSDSAEFFYGPLWEDDIWQLNEVNQAPQQDACSDIRPLPCQSAGDPLSNF